MPRTTRTFRHDIGGRPLILEVSSFAEQANAAVVAQYGDTVVLGTAVMSDADRTTDFMPLRVDYEERFYATGKILGSRFMRRESRPSEEAVLTGRLIDRTIRPLFDQRIRRDIQVVATTLAADEVNAPDFVAMAAVSAALHISDIPWNGPAAGVRVASIGGELVINPTHAQLTDAQCAFETYIAGPRGVINMIEFAGTEQSEDVVRAACAAAQREIDGLIAFFEKVRTEIGKPKTELALLTIPAPTQAVVDAFLRDRLAAAIYTPDKHARGAALATLRAELETHLVDQGSVLTTSEVEYVFERACGDTVHQTILDTQQRPDGRGIHDLRPLSAEVGLFDRTHGSAFFSRGSTQSLAITTLAAPGNEQLIEGLDATSKRRFMLHYNFPPYSTGEIGAFRGPGRREIGHGALARKALDPMLPEAATFPYTVRVVSEVLSSNGSSSMATVCAATLSLMDAGVPLKKPVAGIAMGLVADDAGRFAVLTDLQGAEDHWGDMDFKVAGTKDGITAIQLDTKIAGLTDAMIAQALTQAHTARQAILDVITTTLPSPRPELSRYAPLVVQLSIDPDKIGLLIGPGGKMINGLIAQYELAGIDVTDDGAVSVSGTSKEAVNAAVAAIHALTHEYEVGEVVEGTIIKLLEFGAIVDLGAGRDGMIHVSELREGFVQQPSDVVKVGEVVRAKIIRVEDGRIGLSLKRLDTDHGTTRA